MIKKVFADSMELQTAYAVGHRILMVKDDGDQRYIAFSDVSSADQVAKALRSLADWVEGKEAV